jgi:hypothetical protein
MSDGLIRSKEVTTKGLDIGKLSKSFVQTQILKQQLVGHVVVETA